MPDRIRSTVEQAAVKFLSARYSESGTSWAAMVSEVSSLESTQQARETYEDYKATQKLFL
jgi:hypothetical protein